MAQRGILSFFGKADSKSPSSSQKPKQPTPDSRKKKKKRRVAASPPEDTPDETTPDRDERGREPAPAGADSPVFKKRTKKRKRVIFDSDDDEGEEKEGADEGGQPVVNVVDTPDKASCGGEGDAMEGDLREKGEGEVAEEDDERMIQNETENGDKSTENGRVEMEKINITTEATTAVNGSVSSAHPPPSSLTDSELLRTPPKRKTARKHTGSIALNTTSPAAVKNVNSATSPPRKKQKTVSEMTRENGSADSSNSIGCGESRETRAGREEEVRGEVEGGGEAERDDSESVSDRVGEQRGEEEKEDHLMEEHSSKPREEEGVEEMEV